LRATIDWSYELLSAEEQTLWRWLSVFAGGWSLEAAEVVCAGMQIEPGRVLDLLTNLIDKSLVMVDQQATKARYRFLETIRQYGVEKLSASGERERVRALHFNWCLCLATRAEGESSKSAQRLWFERLEAERDNLRAALQWSLYELRDAERGLRLCVALWPFWHASGPLSEGRKWFDAALLVEGSAKASLRAKALHGASALASMHGDFEKARAFLEQSLILRREINDKLGVAHELQRLGIIAYYTGDYRRAATLQEESLTLCHELGDLHGIARAIGGLGILALDQENYDQATARFEECLKIYRQENHRLGIMGTLNNLGEAAQRRGDFDGAEKLLEESLMLAQELGDKGWIARSVHLLGQIANDRGNYELAINLLTEALNILREIGDAVVVHVLEGFACTAAGQRQMPRAFCLAEVADALREATHMMRTPAEQSALDRYLKAATVRLSNLEIEQAKKKGRAMSLDQAVAYALQAG